jgi:drug/metabolite transporter (DMT)-like permease
MFFRGLEITTPINASLIMTSTPVLVLSLSSILGIERLIFRKVLGLIIGIVGAIYLITSGFDFTHFSQTNLGDLYVLINASAFALYLILSKPLLKTYDPIQVVLVCFAIGLIFVSPFGIPELVDVKWRSFNLNVWLSFGFVLLFTTGLAYLFNAFALKRVNPSIVGIYIYMQPLIASWMGLYLGQQKLEWHHLVSGILIFTSVFMVSLPAKKKKF